MWLVSHKVWFAVSTQVLAVQSLLVALKLRAPPAAPAAATAPAAASAAIRPAAAPVAAAAA
jgi:hypothetical protein